MKADLIARLEREAAFWAKEGFRSTAENIREAVEALEQHKALYHSANVLMAVLGMHGEISARDDRATAVMDALHAIDSGTPLEDPNARDAGRYRYLRERDLDTIKKGGVFVGLVPQNLVLNKEHADAAIDAAISKEKP